MLNCNVCSVYLGQSPCNWDSLFTIQVWDNLFAIYDCTWENSLCNTGLYLGQSLCDTGLYLGAIEVYTLDKPFTINVCTWNSFFWVQVCTWHGLFAIQVCIWDSLFAAHVICTWDNRFTIHVCTWDNLCIYTFWTWYSLLAIHIYSGSLFARVFLFVKAENNDNFQAFAFSYTSSCCCVQVLSFLFKLFCCFLWWKIEYWIAMYVQCILGAVSLQLGQPLY